MICFRACVFLALLSVYGHAYSQSKTDSLISILPTLKEDSAKVDVLLKIGLDYRNKNFDKSIQYSKEAKELAEKIGFKKGIALALKNIGLAYYSQGNYPEVLSHWNESLLMFQSINDKSGEANLLSNIGAVYFNHGDNIRALENYFRSLKIAEEINDKLRIATLLMNIGAAYFNDPITFDKALEYYSQAIQISEEIKDLEAIGTSCGNMGEIYLAQGDFPKALVYFQKSEEALRKSSNSNLLPLVLSNIGKVYSLQENYDVAVKYQEEAYSFASQFGYKLEMARTLANLGDTYRKFKKNSMALDAYKKAEAIALEIGSKYELKTIYEGLSSLYANQKDYKNAFQYQQSLADVKDALYTEETAKSLDRLQFEFDIEKKEAQINLLTKDKEVQTLELQKQQLNNNLLFVGLGLVLAVAFFLYRNNQIKVKANKILASQNREISMQKEEISAHLDDIDRQKVEIENLMLNILPIEVAQELRKTGRATPRYYESASILFTDFKEFTQMAEALTADELVVRLNECFIAFDDIIGQFGLEKIKTIGDAYMCAGGIPTSDSDHPVRTVQAAMAIQKYICEMNQLRKQKGEAPWELRVGIHTGPVVAGVVGHKKFAYDIWGSSVNLAARMEANGETGRVNISEATYQLVKNKFQCNYRGKVLAKNMGEVDMYFVESEIM